MPTTGVHAEDNELFNQIKDAVLTRLLCPGASVEIQYVEKTATEYHFYVVVEGIIYVVGIDKPKTGEPIKEFTVRKTHGKKSCSIM